MAKIENPIFWCDATTNAVTGCTEVSSGCVRCYAKVGTRARILRAQGRETWGAKGERVPVNFEPVFRRLNKLCVCDKCHVAHLFQHEAGNHQIGDPCAVGPWNNPCPGRLRRIRLFADSNSDWLDPAWPVETLARFLDAIRLAPNVDVQLLTKRIELFKERMAKVLVHLTGLPATDDRWKLVDWLQAWESGRSIPPQIWLGVSVEDQKRADERIPLLLQTPAAIRFLSIEPLLSAVDILPQIARAGKTRIDQVIVGGESGAHRRDCGVEAIVSVAEQCATAGVPCYVKQDSGLLPGRQGRIPDAVWSRKEFPR